MAIIDRVKYDGPKDTLVWKWPSDQLSWGTQVIVNQSQEALFYKGGQVLDVLPPGTHTLKTANIPLLRSVVNVPFGGETPFAAEIYYVNKTANLDVKWGTREPIPLQDPKFQIFVPVRAFGQFGLKIQDSKHFVVELVGTMPEFNKDDVIEHFRGVVNTRTKDMIAEALVKEKISILEISANLNEISEDMHKSVQDEFNKYGIEILNFFVNSINVPEDDPSIIRLKKALADKAEMEIMGDARYRTMRTFDTMEKAAENEGGGAGSMMGAGMGLGMGAGAGMGMAGMVGNVMQNAAPAPAPEGAAPPPLPQQAQFYLGIGGQQAGPFDAAGLQQQIASGALTPETLAWQQNMPQWTPAGQIPEIANLFGAAPPPLPPQ